MSKQVILQEIRSIVSSHFNVEVYDLHKSLFASDIGFQPRDLVTLVMLLENQYKIKFSADDFSTDEFDCLNKLSDIIYKYLNE